jgi:hypothetical protein
VIYDLETYNKKILQVFLVIALTSALFFGVFLTAHGATGDNYARDVLSGTGESLGTAGDFLVGGLANVVAQVIKWLASWVMVAGGTILDFSIDYSIRSQNLESEGVKIAWKVIRDVANMTFIFILLYIAISTILQAGGVQAKRALSTLVVVALLVNFSFFLTGIVIDTGNILALSIYNELRDVSGDGVITDDDATISEQFSAAMQLQSVFDRDSGSPPKKYQQAVANMLGAVFFLVAGFVFLAGAIMFILRTVVLMFSLILAPLAFVAAILPKTQHHFNTWLNQLVQHSFVAPVFLLMVLVVLQVVQGGTQIVSNVNGLQGAQVGSFADAITAKNSDPSTFAIILVFAIIIGLMMGVIIVSRSMAGNIANLSVTYAGKATGMAAGGASWVGRRTGGRFSRWVSKKDGVKDWATSNNIAKRYAGLATQRLSQYGARASFDARAIPGARLGAGQLGTDFGSPGGRGGYEAIRRGQIDVARKRAEELVSTQATKEERVRTESAEQSKLIAERDMALAEEIKQKAKSAIDKNEAQKLVESARKRKEQEESILKIIEKQQEARKSARVEAIAQRHERAWPGPLMSAEAKREVAGKMRENQGGRSTGEKTEATLKKILEDLQKEGS